MIFFFFLLGYHKIEEKQKFNALDIVDSLSQEIWSLSYVTLTINIVFFRCADPETYDYYRYYFAERPTRKNSPDRPYYKKVSCLRLTYNTGPKWVF